MFLLLLTYARKWKTLTYCNNNNKWWWAQGMAVPSLSWFHRYLKLLGVQKLLSSFLQSVQPFLWKQAMYLFGVSLQSIQRCSTIALRHRYWHQSSCMPVSLWTGSSSQPLNDFHGCCSRFFFSVTELKAILISLVPVRRRPIQLRISGNVWRWLM